MKKLLFILLLFAFVASNAQSNLVFDSSRLINNKMFNYYHDNRRQVYVIPAGEVLFPSTSVTSTINYLPGGSYVSSSSGTAIKASGFANNIIGDHAGDSLNGGSYNNLFGLNAGRSITTANDNQFFGWDAGSFTTTGSGNVGMVEDALHFNIDGRDNFAACRGAQYSHPHPINNINIGYNTSYYQVAGIENSFLGPYAGGFIKSGSGNSGLGGYAGEINDTSLIVNYCTFLGYEAGISPTTQNGRLEFSTMLGFNTQVTGSFQFNYDNTIFGFNRGTPNSKVGIGTRTPQFKLDVAGDARANTIIVNQATPTTLLPGQITADDNYLYVGTTTGMKRIALDVLTSTTSFIAPIYKLQPQSTQSFMVYDPSGRLIGKTGMLILKPAN
jgi:hypothetical protein